MLLFRQPGKPQEKTATRGTPEQVRSLAIIFTLAALTLPLVAQADDLDFSPASGSETTGSEFTVDIVVNPSQSINAAQGTVTYDNTLLSLESFSKDNSVFSLWTSEPKISQANGTLDFSGGTPTAFSSSGTVLTMKFKALKAGTAKLGFKNGSVLAADGNGTDVYKSAGTASYTIADGSAADQSTANTASQDTSGAGQGSSLVDSGPPPIAPIVNSTAFPEASGWYATSTGDFNWNLPADATAVLTLLTTDASATPTQVLKPLGTSTTVTGIKDGVSYFLVQVKNASGWGDIGSRMVQIDTVPPEAFKVTLVPSDQGSVPKLSFKATDALSGIDHYEVVMGSSTVATVLAKDSPDGTYPVPPQSGGPQAVTIKAYDAAGNETDETATLTLPAVAAPTKASDTSTTAPAAGSGSSLLDHIIEIALAFMVGALASWIRYARNANERIRLDILKRIAEMGDKNDRVFSAMREEFEQMVNDFDKKPQLTPEERALLEDIKEVLDISEEIIDTSVDELKKMVRGAKTS